MDLINRYFPDLTEAQRAQLAAMEALYPEWNAKINVISRRDIDNLEERHLLHSLAPAKFLTPAHGTRILDLGTGGGLPGLPLAVAWPQAQLHLIDRIAKKIRVAEDVAARAGVTNVTFQAGDSGECHERFSYVVSRAVMPLADLVKAVRGKIGRPQPGNPLPPGLIALKGGDLADELKAVQRPVIQVPLTDYFDLPFFRDKFLVYVEL